MDTYKYLKNENKYTNWRNQCNLSSVLVFKNLKVSSSILFGRLLNNLEDEFVIISLEWIIC